MIYKILTAFFAEMRPRIPVSINTSLGGAVEWSMQESTYPEKTTHIGVVYDCSYSTRLQVPLTIESPLKCFRRFPPKSVMVIVMLHQSARGLAAVFDTTRGIHEVIGRLLRA